MERKTVRWMGDSRKRLRGFPDAVRFEIGQALYQAELGEPHTSARTMQGLNAVEIVSDYCGDTYRGVYTTRIKGFIYVLHCFQKKSKVGLRTPKRDLELIRSRLADAELHFKSTPGREE
jgi:phage-related protein